LSPAMWVLIVCQHVLSSRQHFVVIAATSACIQRNLEIFYGFSCFRRLLWTFPADFEF